MAYNNKEKNIRAMVRKYLKDSDKEIEDITDYIDDHSSDYSEDLEEFAFLEAVKLDRQDYVEEKITDIYEDCLSEALELAKSDEVREQIEEELSNYEEDEDDEYSFIDLVDSYYGADFAIESLDWTIVSFKSSFQQEVFYKYLKKNNITEEDAIKILKGDIVNSSVERELKCIGAYVNDDSEIEFINKYKDNGMELQYIIEDLGYHLSFAGDSWKFETIGVYYVD